MFLPSTCGSEQNEASQKYPRPAVAAISLHGTVEPPVSLSSFVFKGVLFAFLPVHSICL